MSRYRCLCTVIVGMLILVAGAAASPAEEIVAADFRSNGDFIDGWYWLRDASLENRAWWTFEGIPEGVEDIVLEITCLATDRPSGPPGIPARFRLSYGFPGSGMMGGVFTAQEVTLPNVSLPTDPAGYTCRGTVVIPRSTPGLDAGTLTVFAERVSSIGPHVAFNRESIVVRGAEGPSSGGANVTSGSPCQRAVDGLIALTSELELPDYLAEEGAVKRGTEFDVNGYFGVLDRLSMEPGYVLDYAYRFEGMGGRPVLYARPEGRPPFAAYEDLAAVEGDPQDAYLRHVRIEGTPGRPEGYLQFVVLAIMGEQFYLYWHAFYNDTLPVCSAEAVEQVLAMLDGGLGLPMSSADRASARAIDVEPRVSVDAGTVRVRLVTFGKWAGFVERIYTISRAFPHEILNTQSSTLVEYDCGVLF